MNNENHIINNNIKNVENKNDKNKNNDIIINNNIEDNNTENNIINSLNNKENENIPIQIKIPKKAEFDCVLKNINFTVKRGEKVAIIGEVGSGKSSLLQAILNSLIILNPLNCDGIHINGKIGYVSQNNWIQNQTIKNNILFFNK